MDEPIKIMEVKVELDKRDAKVLLIALRNYVTDEKHSNLNRISAEELIDCIAHQVKDFGIK